METRRLEYFVDICNAGSLTRAAARLGLSQAALSQQLAILEAEFKTRLLDRTRTGVKPTAAGEAMLREAQLILRQVTQARAAVTAESRQLSGTVSVGFTAGTAALFGVPLMQAARERHPRIRLTFLEAMTGELTERVINGQLDMATLLRNETRAGVRSTPMYREELHLISPSSYGLPPAVRLAESRSLRILLPSARQTLRALYDAAFRQAEVTPNVVAEIDSVSLMRAAVIGGVGATIHPLSSWQDEMQAGVVRASRIEDVPLSLNFWLSRSTPPSTPAADAIFALLEIAIEKHKPPHSER
ncbi:MAG: LysR substrate-binding domain-containing protein [Variibacter sp.]